MKDNNTDHVFGYVLEVLTTGLYPNNLDVIREYIQNAYDAVKTLRNTGLRGSEQIHITIEENSITIHDTGIGMDRDTVEKYKYFGYSEKTTINNTGFRGIGKLAGLSVAKDLEVITSKYGVPYQYNVRFSASKMLEKVIMGKEKGENYPLNELISEHTIIQEKPENINSHYTQVVLHDIKEAARDLLDEKILRKHISQVMPVDFSPNFKLGPIIQEKLLSNIASYYTVDIYVNNEKVYKPYVDADELTGLEFFPVYNNDENGEIIAFAWVMKNGNRSKAIPSESIKNIRIIYKGFMIGDRDLITNSLFTSGRSFLASWFAGEVYPIDEKLIPTSARDHFESNNAREMLFLCLREHIGKKLDRIANQTSQNNTVKKELEKAEKVSVKFEKMKEELAPPELFKLQKKEIEQQISKLQKKIKNNKLGISEKNLKNAKSVVDNLINQQKSLQDIVETKIEEQELNLSHGEKQVYEIMSKSIKTFFQKHDLNNDEELITHAYQKLVKVFGSRKSL